MSDTNIDNVNGKECHGGPALLCGHRAPDVDRPDLPYGTYVCSLAPGHAGDHAARHYVPDVDLHRWPADTAPRQVEHDGARGAVQHIRADELDGTFVGREVMVPLSNAVGGPVVGVVSDVARYLAGDPRDLLVACPRPDGVAIHPVESEAPVHLIDVYVAGRVLHLRPTTPVLVAAPAPAPADTAQHTSGGDA